MTCRDTEELVQGSVLQFKTALKRYTKGEEYFHLNLLLHLFSYLSLKRFVAKEIDRQVWVRKKTAKDRRSLNIAVEKEECEPAQLNCTNIYVTS